MAKYLILGLIERVREINHDAAVWLTEHKDDDDIIKKDSDNLSSIMTWEDTPQGHCYWFDISSRLPE